jgi:hypothetical protein
VVSATGTGRVGEDSTSLLADTYVALSAPEESFGSQETLAVAAGGLGTCGVTEITYLQFDLSDAQQAATSGASLVLDVTFASSANTGHVVLYAVTDMEAGGDAPWQEDTLTWPDRPELDSTNVLAMNPTPMRGGRVTFRSAALTAAINQESAFRGDGDLISGDDVLSLALQIEGCTGLNSVVRLAAKEHTQAAAPQLAISAMVWLPLLP